MTLLERTSIFLRHAKLWIAYHWYAVSGETKPRIHRCAYCGRQTSSAPCEDMWGRWPSCCLVCAASPLKGDRWQPDRTYEKPEEIEAFLTASKLAQPMDLPESTQGDYLDQATIEKLAKG